MRLISDFQMEVVSKEKLCGIIDDWGLNACRNGNCVDKVNVYTCDCDRRLSVDVVGKWLSVRGQGM